MPGLARVTWRAAGYAANLARGRNNWPNDCKTKTPVPEELKSLVTEESGVESPIEVVHEAVEAKVVAGGSSIRLLIRV